MTTLPFISRAESQTPRYLKIMKGIFIFKGAGDISFFLFFLPFCIVCDYPPFRPHCSLSYSRLVLSRLVRHRLSDEGREKCTRAVFDRTATV